MVPGFLVSILAMTLYWPALDHAFLRFDTSIYVTENREINAGLTQKGFVRAFRFPKEGDKTYYHPFSFVSHMVDCELFGLNPKAHHLMNILFHAANAFLLFLLLHRTTGMVFQSVLAAAIFAVHPLQVETVSWVAERKNLLSTFFWFAALLSYTRYAEKATAPRYILTVLLFVFGLMSKPILLTLPCTLLLLDLWPLGRFRFVSFKQDSPWPAIKSFLKFNRCLIVEKIPLFLISGIYFLVITQASRRLNESPTLLDRSLELRLSNALLSYRDYLFSFFWPFDLAVFYPYPIVIPPWWQIVSSVLLLLLLTFIAVKVLQHAPHITVGWFWFLGTLFPAIGFMQTGLWPARADRWMYVPLVGILFVLFRKPRSMPLILKKTTTVLSVFFVICLFFTARCQLTHWKSQQSVFEQAIRVTENNHYAYYAVGLELLNNNLYEKALHYFQKAKEHNDTYDQTYIGMARVFIAEGKYLQALEPLQSALALKPNSSAANFLLGLAYLGSRQVDISLPFFRKALNSGSPKAIYYNGLGMALMEKSKFEEAAQQFNKALSLSPGNTAAKKNLAIIQQKLKGTK